MIDIKRLATDAAYWDELAIPETANWAAIKNGSLVGWAEYSMGDESILNIDMIHRPQSKPEWVDGLPPIGVECELKRGDEWVPVKITGRGERVTVFRKLESFMEHITEAEAHEFRPIRTPEQRQREKLMSIVACGLLGDDGKEANRIVDTILSRYTLEPKP